MNIKEQGIRKRIGSKYLIGCFTQQNDGRTCFTDIRGSEGDLINIPSLGKDLEVGYSGKLLEVGVFYAFNWHLSDDDRILIDGDVEKINNTKFLTGIFEARLRLSGSNLELFNNFQKTIFNEVTGAHHTYIYELLQNANDYPYNGEHVQVKFVLTEHYLFFMHSGACFNLRNVVGISSINQGEKKKNKEVIGYKGIGFKTVFVNNEYVYLKSGDWSFRFDKQYSEEKSFGECPWALMPIPTKDNELDSEVITTLKHNPMRVQFALRHKLDARQNIEQLDKVFSDNQILLFIPNVYKVDVIIDRQLKYTVAKDDTKWIVTDYRYAVPQDLKDWVMVNINSGDKIPEKFKNIDNVRISFAVGRNGKKLLPVENARVYNYLPTELRLGFNFLFNADFVPNGSRSGLHDVNWNDRIMKQCGSQFADWWVSFLQEEHMYDMNSVFDILPHFDSHDKYAQLFLQGFSRRITKIPCIPTLRDGYYHLVKLEDVLYDKIGFIACENPILTDEELYEFSDTTGSLPHPAVRCNDNLIRLLKIFKCSIPFDNNDLSQLCFEEDFHEWLAQEDHDYKFLGFLLKSEYIMNYLGYQIFLTENGKIDKADRMYYDIDNFSNDLSFLSNDLPRLNVELRKKLTGNYNNWESHKGRFKTFNDYVFVKNIFDNFSKYMDLFSSKENSIHFIHFLSVTHSLISVPQEYPFFLEDGSMVTIPQDVYQSNDKGSELSLHSWIDKSWLKFLHKEYFVQNNELVSNYLSSKCGIKALNSNDIYHLFIANDSRVPVIASKIKEKTVNIDFFHYLLQIRDDVNNLTNSMRQNYCIFTTDGKTEWLTPITKTIFWQEDEWAQMAQTIWMPEGCCLAIDNCYFEGLTEEERAQLKALFSTKQIVQKFSVSGMYQSLHTHLKINAFGTITTKELSKDILNFLFKHQAEIFKNGQIDDIFKKIPILCKGNEELATIESYEGRLYIPSQDALDLYIQPWFNQSAIALCDDYYLDMFDGSERCRFFEKLGLKKFDKIHYFHAHLLVHLEQIKNNLKNISNNISFHRYIADFYEELSDKDLEHVKEMPIYISSTNEKGAVLAERSDNHYLPSIIIKTIISKDLVPTSILDSIHPDYIVSEKEKRYFIDKLGNNEINEEGFYNYIIKDNIAPTIITYLKEEERNITFWRWICDSNESKENKAKLNIFPLLFRYDQNTADGYETPNKLFISDQYFGIDGLECFIKEYVYNPKFISLVYKEDGIERDWTALFKSLGVKVDHKDIIFRSILPNLTKYKDTKVVGILAKYVDTIMQKLFNNDEKIVKDLENLYLKCNDGIYRTPKNVFVSGKYYDINVNSFPDIEINNLVSEEYISDTENDTERRNVIKFFVSIADYYDVKLDSATQLRNIKLSYFSKHQDFYAQSEAHYRIIGELAKSYNSDPVGISEIIRNLGPIKLYTITDKLTNSSGLYLSTIYLPDCQYMANGITELDFVSEKYNEFCKNDFKHMLIHCLGVYEDFNVPNLKLLQNERFALYFWKDYAQSRERELKEIITEENLKNIACIPTLQGMKKPEDVYDYRNPQLQKIVANLRDGKDKLPVVELPKWVEKIGFRGNLYILDCLEYLSLDTHDYRRNVIKWFVETQENIIKQYKNNIDQYRKTANWFNGAKNWVPLRNLVALEWGNKTLKDNFGGNAYVCHPSYMPEFKDDYEKLCKILNIKILSNEDFTKKKVGDCQKDTEAVTEISKRLLYLAYRTGKDNWEEIYASYKEKLDKADISRCQSIIYSYDEHIATDLEIYSEEATALWYVDSWQGPMFLQILNWIKREMEIKGDFDPNFFQKLFLRPFVDFIKLQEGGSLPTALLAYLDEKDRGAIDVDKNIEAKVFAEDTTNISSLPEDLKKQASLALKQRQNQDFENKKEYKVDNPESLYTEVKDRERPNSERKCRNDFTKTYQSLREPTLEILSEESDPSNSYARDLDKEEIRKDERTPLTDRLHEKWDKQKKTPIQKPHSSKYVSADYNVFNESSINSESNLEFFDEDINTLEYTEKANNFSDFYLNFNKHNQDNFSIKQKVAQEELNKTKDQADLNEAISKTPKYTFLWFKYLMEQLYNQKNDTSASKSVQIDFREAKILNDNIISIFKPNSLVPNWIEHADVVTMQILKGDISEKIEINLEYFTEDAIWVYSENASELETKISKADKVRFIANGSYTNHIGSLTKQFVKLDFPDNYNLRDNLPDSIKYIYGPPGTGKTTRLVSEIQGILEKNDGDLDLLVLTPTNKAADVIASRLCNNDCCSQYTYRFGVTESLEFLESNNVFTRDDEFMKYNGHHIVITTAARYAYDYLMPNEEIICDHKWDYIIVDEASMIDIVTMVFILYKSQNCQFIISGDPNQIQPVKQNEIQPENIYQMIGLNSFAAAHNNPKVECLNTQYRSIPTIGNLVSKFSYNGIVKSHRSQNSQKPLKLGFKISSINFIGFKTEILNNLYGLDAINGSAFHLYSVIFGYEYASYIAKCIKENHPDDSYSIGIVCPYKKQADSIRQMFELRDMSNDSCKIHCGTVHSFQGDECDIMIIVLNPPINVGVGSHVNNQNIINVAMSRARDYVFFLVPDNMTPGFPTREVLGKITEGERSILYCNEIEKIMFDQEDYIELHTNVTCHMPVNIYYGPSSLYEVRKDDMVVDIQINEEFR